MQIQNNVEVCFVKVFLCQRAYSFIKKNVHIWKNDNDLYVICNDFRLIMLFEFICSSIYSILAKIKALDFFLLYYILEIGSHVA